MAEEVEPDRDINVPHPVFNALIAPLRTEGLAPVSSEQISATLAQTMPDSVLVRGFGAGEIEHAGQQWLLVYRDEAAQDWMLIPRDACLEFSPGLKQSPLTGRPTPDSVRVSRHARVYVGRGAHPIELMFVSGSLTTADDLEPTLGTRGGAEPGLFAPSPPLCGCGRKTV